MILHIDMDAFFASIEQAINPKLKGKPLIVGSRQNKMHTVVCAASYEAKALGIDSGMPSADAFRICPNLEFVPAEQSKYIWTSEQICKILEDFGYQICYASIDEFQMDIAGLEQPLNLAKNIQDKIYKAFGITASIGIAKNCLLAKLGSKINKPRGITIINEQNLDDILFKTPVKKLRGVGQKFGLVLDNLGIKTCLDLYQKTPYFMKRNFGQNGVNFYEELHANDRFQIQERPDKPKSIGHSYTLPRASRNPEFIKAWVRLLAEMVAKRLREANLVSRTVHLWLNGPEIGNFGAQKTFCEPNNDGVEIYRRCLKVMAKSGSKRLKIRALGVSCSGLLENQYYAPLFREQRKGESLIKAMDKINDRLGQNTIFPAVVFLTQRMQ